MKQKSEEEKRRDKIRSLKRKFVEYIDMADGDSQLAKSLFIRVYGSDEAIEAIKEIA
jgi:hypothetical protein